MVTGKKFLRIIFAVLAFVLMAQGASEAALSAAPASERFLEQTVAASATDESGGRGGYLPFPIEKPRVASKGRANFLAEAAERGALPAKYDLRDEGYVTPAKKQNYSNCWAYSAIGSVESIYKKSSGRELDLSEMHLTWFSFNTKPAFKTSLASGAFDNTAVALLSRWIGPVLESDLPESVSNPTGKFHDYPNRLHLRDAYFLGLEFDHNNYDTSTTAVRKQLVYDHGGISVGVNSHSFEGQNYNAAKHAAYSTSRYVDHAVLLCGWDDNFSRANFTTTPPGDGAWLIKNSRGESAGDNGYQWVSYYDASLCDGVAFITDETSNYDKHYTYDELGWCWSVGLGTDTAWMANVFASGARSEDLKAVSFYTTANDAEYEIKIHTNLTDASDPTGGTLAATKSGTHTFGGYHTVDLDSPVALAPGTKFAVVVKVTTPGYDYPVPVEMPLPKEIGSSLCDNATANRGESFVSQSGATWDNAMVTSDGRTFDVNVCVKAFTSGGGGNEYDDDDDDDDDDNGGGGGGGGGCRTGAGLFGLLCVAVIFMFKRVRA